MTKHPSDLPHRGVFARLKTSPLHGVGVFAIRDIPQGTSIFFGDDADIVWVRKVDVENVDPELRRLYEDFCISKGEYYGCPSNFNQLTLAWYLNESEVPNVGIDQEYRFHALRDIAKGEELTTDYKTFND